MIADLPAWRGDAAPSCANRVHGSPGQAGRWRLKEDDW